MADSEALLCNSDSSFGETMAVLADAYREHGYVLVTIRTGKQRTNKQNRAMHKYFTLLAQALNAQGQDQRVVLATMREGVQIPWDAASVKAALWKPVQEAILGKESTTQLERPEVSRIYESLNKWTGDKLGVSMSFPSED